MRGRITCSVDIDAPREGRPTTRVNWLVRQLKNAPEDLRIEAFAAHARGPGAAELLRVAREDPTALVADPAKELKTFRVALSAPIGTKRGRGRGSFIDSVLDAIDVFYGEVVQRLKAWSAAPPRLRAEPERNEQGSDVPTALISTALSSQDGAETESSPNGEATPRTVGTGPVAKASESADPAPGAPTT